VSAGSELALRWLPRDVYQWAVQECSIYRDRPRQVYPCVLGLFAPNASDKTRRNAGQVVAVADGPVGAGEDLRRFQDLAWDAAPFVPLPHPIPSDPVARAAVFVWFILLQLDRQSDGLLVLRPGERDPRRLTDAAVSAYHAAVLAIDSARRRARRHSRSLDTTGPWTQPPELPGWVRQFGAKQYRLLHALWGRAFVEQPELIRALSLQDSVDPAEAIRKTVTRTNKNLCVRREQIGSEWHIREANRFGVLSWHLHHVT
jgi:hypothetical protein